MVGKQGIRADPSKVKDLIDWPVPKSLKELQTFLGFCGYYRKFVPNYARIVKPLYDLTAQKRKGDLGWNAEHDEAFGSIITKLTEPPILAYADYTLPFELHVDASTSGLGAVLYQNQNGCQRVIAYGSKSLTKGQRNYPAHKLEFLALKWAITEKFHEYLYGRHFTVMTDNNPLTYILSSAKLDAAGHRWLAALGAYNFTIKYRAGVTNADADGLSRQREEKSATISPEIFAEISRQLRNNDVHVSCSTNVPSESESGAVQGSQSLKLFHDQREDPEISALIHAISDSRHPDFSGQLRKWRQYFQNLSIRDGILVHKAQIDDEVIYRHVIPVSCRDKILRGCHDDMGHPAEERLVALLRLRYFWPGMVSDSKRWIDTCRRCVCRKKLPERAALHSLSSTHPFELVSMDYLKVEPSEGYENILVLTDHFTKFAVAVPTKNQTARTTANAIYNHLVLPYGIPSRLHSDQGANFESNIVKELCKLLGIDKSRTTPYHAMGNGQCERMNRTLLSMLGTLTNDQKKRWKSHLSSLVYAYNCTPHSSSGYSPYFLLFGRHPKLPVDQLFNPESTREEFVSKTAYADSLRRRLEVVHDIAAKSQADACAANKTRYDSRTRGAGLQVGDTCLVRRRPESGEKLGDKWEDNVHVVVRQPNPDIPVFVVEPQEKPGRSQTLHRNNLLPLGLPLRSNGDEEPKQQRTRRVNRRHLRSSNERNVANSDGNVRSHRSASEVDSDASGSDYSDDEFKIRHRIGPSVPPGPSESNVADTDIDQTGDPVDTSHTGHRSDTGHIVDGFVDSDNIHHTIDELVDSENIHDDDLSMHSNNSHPEQSDVSTVSSHDETVTMNSSESTSVSRTLPRRSNRPRRPPDRYQCNCIEALKAWK